MRKLHIPIFFACLLFCTFVACDPDEDNIIPEPIEDGFVFSSTPNDVDEEEAPTSNDEVPVKRDTIIE